jgi:hypothetical protein
MNHVSDQKIYSCSLLSLPTFKIVNVVNQMLGICSCQYFDQIDHFLNFAELCQKERKTLVMYTEWYMDIVYGSVSQSQSSLFLDQLIDLSKSELVSTLAISPFGTGVLVHKKLMSSPVRLIEGTVSPTQIVRAFSVQ